MTQVPGNESGGSTRGFWRSTKGKFTIGGLLSVTLAAAAGFLSPEVRQVVCLELPKPEELIYAEPEGSTPYRELSAQALQPSFDGKLVRFKVRAFAEMSRAAYQGVQSAKYDDYSIASIADADRKQQDGPFGPPMPDVAVLLSPELAKQWSNIALGAVVQVDGTAQFLPDFLEDSSTGARLAALRGVGQDVSAIRIPDYADFWVVADKVTPLRALNDPRDRLMCKWRNLQG